MRFVQHHAILIFIPSVAQYTFCDMQVVSVAGIIRAMGEAYRTRLKRVCTTVECALFARLNSPQKIQDYLDTLPINFEIHGETYMSPRRTIAEQTAHCLEGALVAAAAFAYHGKAPLLLDFQTTHDDEDHVVAPFEIHGYWGAVSKTNHAILRYRDPVYRSIRELALSYFHEYFNESGKKTLRTFSKPFDLSRYAPDQWVCARDDLYWLVEALDASRHFPVVPAKNVRALRSVSKIEIESMRHTEWKQPHKFILEDT